MLLAVAPRSCLVKRYNNAGRQPGLVQPNPLLRNTDSKFCSVLLLPHVPGAILSLLGSWSYSSSQTLQAWAHRSHASYNRLNPSWLHAPGPSPGPVICQSTPVDSGDSALHKTGRGRGSEWQSIRQEQESIKITLSPRMGTETLCKTYIFVRCAVLLNNSLNCKQMLGQQANVGKQLSFSA